MTGSLLSFLSLALVLLAVGLLACVAAAVLIAYGLLRPPRMTDGKALYLLRRLSPTDLGLEFEEVTFTVREEPSGRTIRIAGWWIPAKAAADVPVERWMLDVGCSTFEANGVAGLERPTSDPQRPTSNESGRPGAAPPGRCVILLHGYADAKVGGIAWAPVWHALGYHVLAIDLRAHGESGGRTSTAGHLERHDVCQVIDQLCDERPAETAHLVLFGVSLGAAVAAATALLRAETHGGPGDVAAVVLESPFADFRHAADAHMERLGVPGGSIRRAAFALAERLAGARFADLRPVDLIPKIPCPLLVIAPADDPFVGTDDAAEIEAAVRARPEASGPSVYWRAPAAEHGTAVVDDPEEYRERLGQFLEAASSRNPRPSREAAV